MAEESSGSPVRQVDSVDKTDTGIMQDNPETPEDQKTESMSATSRQELGGLEYDEEDEEEELPYPGFAPVVFYRLNQHCKLRYYCLQLITWPWFERCSMAVIILNCITLGMYQPCFDEVCDTMRCQVLAGFDHFIYVFFAIEMIIKMIAMGIFGKLAYLGETWNRLDCFIVIAGSVEYAVDAENLSLSAIRTIRVLRPLRAINRIPSMRILVMLLLDTLPMLGNVLLLCFFVFFIFGIVGVQLWSGILRQRCFLTKDVTFPPDIQPLPVYYDEGQEDIICSKPDASGMKLCSELRPSTMQSGMVCNLTIDEYNRSLSGGNCVNYNQYYTECKAGDKNPYQGAISFDNIGMACVAIFQVISLEGWVDIMYYVQDAHSFWDWLYFVLLIVIGSFFMINLCLVVIATQFSETKKRETERMIQERKRYQSTSTLASNNEPGGCYDEILKYIAHLWRRAKRKVMRTVRKRQGKHQRKVTPERAISLQCRKNRKKRCPHHHAYHIPSAGNTSPRAPRASPEMSDIDPVSSPRRPNHLVIRTSSLNPSEYDSDIQDTVVTFHPTTHQSPVHKCAVTTLSIRRTPSYNGTRGVLPVPLPSGQSPNDNSGAINPALSSKSRLSVDHEPVRFSPNYDKLSDGPRRFSSPHISCTLPDYDPQQRCCSRSEYEFTDSEDDLSSSDWMDEDDEHTSPETGRYYLYKKKMVAFVENDYFQRGILLAILVNTLSMGIEYHDQPDELTLLLEYSNIFFSVLFTVEMALKLIAYGLFGYISNGFNVFDGVIVILSLVELVQGGTGGLSVLRTFRLLRILKLVRFMPALRRQLVVMLRTMDNVAIFFSLLVLFMFIFSTLGVHLFGYKFCHKANGDWCTCTNIVQHFDECSKCERKNFDNIFNAFLTVFQILTQEDWNTVLYNGMAQTSAAASLYFIALMTFGNYVLFNLLVAILVEGFSSEGEEKKKELEDIKLKQQQQKEAKQAAEEEDPKNNKEKERKLLAMSDKMTQDGPLNPPIITRTAATPMATPQGSPNETLNTNKELNNKLSVNQHQENRSNLSLDTGDKSPSNLSAKSSPMLSPSLKRQGSKNNNWRTRNRNRDERTSLVDSQSDSGEEADSSARNSVNYSDCNGHAPLNNQCPLSHQNSIKSIKNNSPRNSIKSRSSSRQNSLTSQGNASGKNSIQLSRQNSLSAPRTPSPRNSISSAASHKDADFKPNNLCDIPQVKITPTVETSLPAFDEPEDPDAMDEMVCGFSFCPEPKGCFKSRADYAFYILPPDSRVRQKCIHLVAQKWFDYTVLFFIALNCITLAMERPSIPPDSDERGFLTYSNYVFTVVFTAEMLIKVTAKGLIIGPHVYLKSGWNILDGLLVMISLIDLLVALAVGSSSKIFGILRVFRLLRTLRPLRVINRAPGLKLVVQTLLSSLRPIGNIVLICCTFFIIFGILGVQLFKGKFYYCVGPSDVVQDVKNKTQCLDNKNNSWQNRKYNFDNLGLALMALFVLASKDGWVSIMYTGIDAVGVDQQPVENYNEWRLLYFISFLLLVGFFVLNMFVGVVVENFHKCRENQEIEERALRAAKRAKRMEKKRRSMITGYRDHDGMRAPPYWANYGPARLMLHTVCNSKYFDLAIAGVIGLNVITMAMEYYMMPPELEFALKIFNYFFTSVFILEAALKVFALGARRYFKDRWNQLDMSIVLLSIVGIILEEMESDVIPINPTIIRVMRVLRIARVLKLLKMAKGIRALLDTVIQALPQVGNLGLLFFLLFFIFAALGVELFGRLECSDEHPCEGLGVHAHFENFGMAFLTLFRVATGDNWNGIMKDTLREDCDADDACVKNCCVSPIISPVYFVVFVLMAQFVLVNVVVAVLMKHLEESHKQMDDEAEMDAEIDRELADEEAERKRISLAAESRNGEEEPPDAEGALLTVQATVEDDRKSKQHPEITVNLRPPSTEYDVQKPEIELNMEGIQITIPDDQPPKMPRIATPTPPRHPIRAPETAQTETDENADSIDESESEGKDEPNETSDSIPTPEEKSADSTDSQLGNEKDSDEKPAEEENSAIEESTDL